MAVLVIGGAGYIGSHMVKMLSGADTQVVILDNLSTGFRELAKYGELIVGDMADGNLLNKIFQDNQFDAVMHFAAFSQVGESVTDPAKYYRNNFGATINLLDSMMQYGVKRFIFSSTAAIFGNPDYAPIDEAHPLRPINPYGHSKLMVERILRDYASAYGLNSVTLRYFNAGGADPEGELGECHDPETHLVPLVLQAASGKREAITVFGRDYPTGDGTCIRDYIHIVDLCSAHLFALKKIETIAQDGRFLEYNLGNGNGFSVQQVIDVAKSVVARDGCNVKVVDGDRRVGDPAVLIADASKAIQELGWQPKYDDLETIIEHAWAWEKKRNIANTICT